MLLLEFNLTIQVIWNVSRW